MKRQDAASTFQDAALQKIGDARLRRYLGIPLVAIILAPVCPNRDLQAVSPLGVMVCRKIL
jgi:hypothetical protein